MRKHAAELARTAAACPHGAWESAEGAGLMQHVALGDPPRAASPRRSQRPGLPWEWARCACRPCSARAAGYSAGAPFCGHSAGAWSRTEHWHISEHTCWQTCSSANLRLLSAVRCERVEHCCTLHAARAGLPDAGLLGCSPLLLNDIDKSARLETHASKIIRRRACSCFLMHDMMEHALEPACSAS